MKEHAASLYKDIAERTNGNLYIGVVGPVRTGKSTFVKRFIEIMVLPYIKNVYQKERAIDELPQSSSGRTIMTSEPKFVPEEAVTISVDNHIDASIRMIDSVGYMVPGVIGADENGEPRMVTTPWFPEEIPMEKAAEIGTKKVMEDHCSIGIVVTCDGSIIDIPHSDYVQAERHAISDMQATGKPFIVLINSKEPEGREAQNVKKALESEFGITCCCVNCMSMEEPDFHRILSKMLLEFPVAEIQIRIPKWIAALDQNHEMKTTIYDTILEKAKKIKRISEAESVLGEIQELESVENTGCFELIPAVGIVKCEIRIPDYLFYRILSGQSGFQIENETDLFQLLRELSTVKHDYDKISAALEQARTTGYGIVMPTSDEMKLEEPRIVRKGSNFGVRLKASAPSIHMMRADIETEISPIVGNEKQSEDLLQYLLQEYEGDTEKIWQSNIFGKSVYELVNEGLGSKLKKMPEHARYKLQSTLSRIINEGSTGLLCIILS